MGHKTLGTFFFLRREGENKKQKVMEDTKDVAIFFTDSPVGIKRICWKVFVCIYIYMYTQLIAILYCAFSLKFWFRYL